MEIGRFYLKNQKYIAAINRFKNVIKDYDTTSHIPEALYRMTEAYLTIGAPKEAQKYAAVLGHNYPKSKWYAYAYRLVGEGKNRPKPEIAGGWLKNWFNDSEGPKAPKTQPLPRDDNAKNWLERIKGVF